MKKILALLLALSMALGLAACSGQDGKESDNSGDSDLAYIQEKGTLVVGITEFEPRTTPMPTATGLGLMRIWPEPLLRAWAWRPSSRSLLTGTAR